MYKLLSFLVLLAVAFAAPAPEPGAAIASIAYKAPVAYIPQIGYAPLPGAPIAYGAQLAYPSYPAYQTYPYAGYPTPIYNKFY